MSNPPNGGTGLVVVVSGGDAPLSNCLEGFGHPEMVIAADSGLEHAIALGLAVDVVVGDMDSVSTDSLRWAESQGAVLERHPIGKDRTDLELAMKRAMQCRPQHLLVLGGSGGRFDHYLANFHVLASAEWAAAVVTAQTAAGRVTVVRGERTLDGAAGSLVSLLAIGGPVSVSTRGLRYALEGEVLRPTSARGVSNLMLGTTAVVSAAAGVLLALQPGDERVGGPHGDSGHEPGSDPGSDPGNDPGNDNVSRAVDGRAN